jgi:hypothetical protein
MNRLSPEEVRARVLTELGLELGAKDLLAIEPMAAALRRAAGMLCPCAAATLTRAVVRPLEGLVPDLDGVRELAASTLDAMIAHGDLSEQRDIAVDGSERGGPLLYATPPTFVTRRSGAVLLVGIAPDRLSPLPEELEARIQYVKHFRRLPAADAEDLRSELMQIGLVEWTFDKWQKAPASGTPAQHLARLDKLLDEGARSGEVPGLTLLDPVRAVHYYAGRWVEPGSLTGRFVGRRSQAYGSDLWSYVQVNGGHPERLIDLPLAGSRARGCDEAWRLQMAIDAKSGEPQRFRVRPGLGGTRLLELFSPVPAFAQRRWDAVGDPVTPTGCLLSYRFSENELSEELSFIRDVLWLAERVESSE